MSEIEDYQALQTTGESALSLMTGVLRALELYDLNNDTVQRILAQLARLIRDTAERTNNALLLQNTGENFFVNQELLRLDFRAFSRLTHLRGVLETLQLNEIELRPEATVESMTLFFQRVLAAVEDPELRPTLADPEETGVSMRFSTGITRKGQVKEERETMALRLDVTLGLLTGEMLRLASDDPAPSTLAVRRVLQGLVDLLDAHLDYVLALAHHGGAAGGLHGHLARSSILAAIVAKAAGLERRRIGRAALGVVLSRAPLVRLGEHWTTAPPADVDRVYDACIQESVRARGSRGLSAWRMVLLHEGQRDLAGQVVPYPDRLAPSFEGELASVVTRYDRIRSGLADGPRGRARSPTAALRILAGEARRQEGSAVRRKVLETLLAVLGRLPPGSLVRVPNGALGVVRRRPEVVLVADPQGRALKSFRSSRVDKALPLEPPPAMDPAPALGWQPPEK